MTPIEYIVKPIIPYIENEFMASGLYNVLDGGVVIATLTVFRDKVQIKAVNNERLIVGKRRDFLDIVNSGKMEDAYYNELLKNAKHEHVCGL